MEDYRYPIGLKEAQGPRRARAGLMDLKANPTYSLNVTRLNELQNGGIPMRRQANWEDKSPADYIFHWKMMLFEGRTSSSSAPPITAATRSFLEPPYGSPTPCANLRRRVSSARTASRSSTHFKTKFDDLWTNTTRFKDYANITGTPTRARDVSIDPEMTFCPAPAGQKTFRTRSVAAYNAETDGIDATICRITDQQHTNAIIAARNRGVAVRLITEQEQ